MKKLKDHIIPAGDDFSISKEIRGAGDKNISFCINDDAQPTVNSSLSAPTLGTALTTTTILLQ